MRRAGGWAAIALSALLLSASGDLTPPESPAPVPVPGSYGGLRYLTIGTPHRDANGRVDNAVLLFPGTDRDVLLGAAGFDELFGHDMVLDAARYLTIVPERERRTARDAVRAEHDFLVSGLRADRLRLIIGQGADGERAWLWGEMYPAQAGAVLTVDAVPHDIDVAKITAPLIALGIPGDVTSAELQGITAGAEGTLHGRYDETDPRGRRGGALHLWYYAELSRQLLGTKVDDVLDQTDDGASVLNTFEPVTIRLPAGWVVDDNPAGIHEGMYRPHPRGVRPALLIMTTGGHFGSQPPPPGTPACMNGIRAYTLDSMNPPKRRVAFDVVQEKIISGIVAWYSPTDGVAEGIVRSIRLPKHRQEC